MGIDPTEAFEKSRNNDLLLALIRVMLRCAKTFITLMGAELKSRGIK